MTHEKNQTANAASAAQTSALAKFVPLWREIGNLKRIRCASSTDSLAARMFERAWSEIIGGADARAVALSIIAEAVVAASLGAIDAAVLQRARLSDAEIETILSRAFDNFAAVLDQSLAGECRAQIAHDIAKNPAESNIRRVIFAERLKNQPRSGATKTGAPKMIFDQPENHAEHCLAVAVMGAICAAHFGANYETVFLIGLIHHFHNAYLPDSGFAGEESLGEFLPAIFDAFRRECLAEVPENLHDEIWKLFAEIETADTPAAKSFHAADVCDRVLQMRHHAEANEFTLRYALEEAELVHAGAVQNFHYEILRAAKLI